MLHSQPGRIAKAGPAAQALYTIIAVFLLTAGLVLPAESQTYGVIHNFAGTDGSDPFAGPTLDQYGHIYGTTNSGGTYGSGIAYKLALRNGNWMLTPLFSFAGGPSGAGPGFGALVIGSDNKLYGTAEGGGVSGIAYNLGPQPAVCPSVFCPWREIVLHIFGRDQDGAQPLGGLAFDSAGNLYGTTSEGGTSNNGAVVQITGSGQNWSESVIYSFAGGTDAANPVAGPTVDASGNIYGTSPFGGANGNGAVYKLTRSGSGWTESVIYSFQGGNDGQSPTGGVIVDAAGNVYGGTFFGGANGGGTVYKLSPSGGGYTLTTLYSFSGFGGPYNKLAFGPNGVLYGATNADGANSKGSVFKLTPSGGNWTFTNLYDFTGGNDGGTPYGGVAVDSSGNVFGTASIGGTNNDGTVWEITP